MLARHFLDIRALHVGCVALSGSLFTARGVLRLKGMPLANHRALRAASVLIDTVLVTAALLLTSILHEYPFVDGWLTAKLLLLVLYVALGWVALKGARTSMGRLAAFGGALLTFTAIIGVAVTRNPLGWLALLY